MEKTRDLTRCTNCWEGIDWQIKPNGRIGECPRCGKKGEITQGGFLVFAPEKPPDWAEHAVRAD